jgi:hypothetical protein
MSGVVSYGTISPVTGWSLNESTKVLTFTTPGTYTFIPNGEFCVDYTVVGGGGGGAGFGGGGGGGETKLGLFYLVNSTSYTITVGNGGVVNGNGSNSTFDLITAAGGRNASSGGTAGGSGNSGAGGAGGSAGGTGVGGAGGDGFLSLYGGGGGGGGYGGGGIGGAGGGGNGNGYNGNGGSGSPNTGGGGGGAGRGSGGLGGSGIVILSNFFPSSSLPTIESFVILPRNYGVETFEISAPISNSVGDFTYTSSNTAVATITGSTVTIVKAGTTIITASQSATPNYSSINIKTPFIVNKAPTTITGFSVPIKTYGDTSFTIDQPSSNRSGSFTYTSSNLSAATITEGNKITIIGAGQSTITATQGETTNYTSGTATAVFTVNKVTPSITDFSITNTTFGVPSFTIPQLPTSNNTTVGLTYTSLNTLVATITNGTTINIVGVGLATIRASQAETANYFSATKDSSFTVTKGTPTITDFSITNTNKKFGDPSFPIEQLPTSNSTTVGLTYESLNTSVATITNGTTINIVGVGLATIRASQAETANYFSATRNASFTVTQGIENVMFGGTGVVTRATVRTAPSLSSIKTVTIKGYNKIGYGAFSNLPSLTKVSIPSSVKTIGDYAFQNCAKLASVVIPVDSQLISIGNFAFQGCPANTSVTIPL